MSNIQNQNGYNSDYLLNSYQIKLNYFQNQNPQQAIQYYKEALNIIQQNQQKSQDFYINTALMKSNIGVCLVYSGEYEEANNQLEQSFLDIQKNKIQNFFSDTIKIKIMSNLGISCLMLNNIQRSQDIITQMLNYTSQQYISQILIQEQYYRQNFKIKQLLFQEILFIFFRFISIQKFEESQFQNINQKFNGIPLACFYSSIALSYEITHNYQQAFDVININIQLFNFGKYFQKSLEIFQQENEIGFSIIVLKHLMLIQKQTPQLQDNNQINFEQMFQQNLKHPSLDNVNIDQLFQGFEEKMDCALQIGEIFKQLEQELQINQQEEQPQLLYSENVWKIALKYRICHSIAVANKILQTPNQNILEQDNIRQSIEQMQQIKNIVEKAENNPLLEKQIQQLDYVKEAQNIFKASINKLKKFIIKLTSVTIGQYFFKNLGKEQNIQFTLGQSQLIQQQQQQQSSQQLNFGKSQLAQSFNNHQDQQQLQQSQNNSNLLIPIKQVPSSQNVSMLNISRNLPKTTHIVISNACKHVAYGSYIIKCNANSNGRRQKYYQLSVDKLKWAKKQHFVNSTKGNSLFLGDIQEVVYGKITKTFLRPFNFSLEKYLCMSLILGDRTLDFYFYNSQNQINYWVIALSHQVKKYNKNAIGLSPGKFFWRKLNYLLEYKLKLKALKQMYPNNYTEMYVDALKQLLNY